MMAANTSGSRIDKCCNALRSRRSVRTRAATCALIAVSFAFAWAPICAGADRVIQVTPARLDAAIARLESKAAQVIAKSGVPGIAIAVVHDDQVRYLGGFGVRDVGKPDAVDADTVFQIASMSKSLASTVVAGLVSDGLVSWDSRIAQLQPAFALHEPWVTSQVTLRDLFSHRSGLSGNAGNDLEALGYRRDPILARLRHLKPASSFRSTYAYSNFGLTMGAIAAVQPSGMSWEDVADKRLYSRLGMTSTSSRYADFQKRPNRAHQHIQFDGRWSPKLTRDPDPQSPAGGVSSSVRDLAQWVRLQLANGMHNGEPVIKAAALQETHFPQIVRGRDPDSGRPAWYGLGWGVDYDEHGRLFLAHSGAFSTGSRTQVNLLPAANLGIVVLTNAFPSGVPEGLTADFFEFVLNGQVEKDWVAIWNQRFGALMTMMSASASAYASKPVMVSAPGLPLVAYAGRYGNDYIGPVEVVIQDGELAILQGPQRIRHALTHFDRDLFIYHPVPEWPDFVAGVTFSIGPDQRASQVVIEDLNDDGQGTLLRMSR